MAENSKIQWTHHTFNPWRGCTKVSPGCANCYAEALAERNPKVLGVWGPNGTRVVASEAQWREPLKWNRMAAEGTCYHCHGKSTRDTPGKCTVCDGKGRIGPYRARVFCASLADVFEDWKGPMVNSKGERLVVGPHGEWIGISKGAQESLARGELQQTETGWLTMDDVRERLMFLIRDTPELDWLFLTKRPENILGTWGRIDVCDVEATFPNLWIGTTVENRRHGVPRIDHLRATPAAVRFLSVEPLLEDLGTLDLTGIHWMIVGGESGHGSRPFDLAWARSIVAQCKAADVPVFVKQLGAVIHARNIIDPLDQFPSNAVRAFKSGPDEDTVELNLIDRKGGDPAAWPADLRVREFPEA